jgi:hypothetical protein
MNLTYEQAKQAVERGEKVECRFTDCYSGQPHDWKPFSCEALCVDTSAFEFRLADPYAELKAAHAAGKVIQENVIQENVGGWIDLDNPKWDRAACYYRVKPDTPSFAPGYYRMRNGKKMRIYKVYPDRIDGAMLIKDQWYYNVWQTNGTHCVEGFHIIAPWTDEPDGIPRKDCPNGINLFTIQVKGGNRLMSKEVVDALTDKVFRAVNSYDALVAQVAELKADAKHIAEQLKRIGVNPAWHNTGEKAAEHAVTLFQHRELEIEALNREIKHAQDTLLSELERLQPCLAALLAIKEIADAEKDDSYCNNDMRGAMETIYQKAREALAEGKE